MTPHRNEIKLLARGDRSFATGRPPVEPSAPDSRPKDGDCSNPGVDARGRNGFPYLRALDTPTSLESKLPCGQATPSAAGCLII